MSRKLNTILLAICLVILSSCGASKKLSYLQDMDTLTTYDVTDEPDIKVSANDRLNITVTCKTPELAAPFNIASGAASVDINNGTVSAGALSTASNGYLVDKQGNISFPILGTINVAGKTLQEVRETIEGEIIAKNYIKDPIVLVEFVNFQITVLGEVNSKGNFIVSNSRINILQAIALAGDIPTSAVIDDIWVIRTEGRERNVYSINLKSKECFNSPAFYLQQNDIVYVKPKKTKLDASSQLALTITSTVMAGVSAIASILYWTLGKK